LAENPEAAQAAGQRLVTIVSMVNETSPSFGSRPLTYACRASQQQMPSAMQHSISQTSGSQEANVSGVEIHPSASANVAAAIRNLKVVSFILSAFTDGRLPFNLEDHFFYYQVSCFATLCYPASACQIFVSFSDVIAFLMPFTGWIQPFVWFFRRFILFQ
jgi:hypothetical protein